MIAAARAQRLRDLIGSRYLEFSALISRETLEEIIDWNRGQRLLGFNNSAVRLRVIYGLAQSFHPTHFIETGTYHGATVICAHRCLRLPIWSCEVLWRNFLVARIVTMGLKQVEIRHTDSRAFLQRVGSRFALDGRFRPIFYLDAHGGADAQHCPLVEELSEILKLKQFIAIIDDFRVPDSEFLWDTYGPVSLDVDLVGEVLAASGVKRIFFPAYSAELEQGPARKGWVVICRDDALEGEIRTGSFPFGLLRTCEIS